MGGVEDAPEHKQQLEIAKEDSLKSKYFTMFLYKLMLILLLLMPIEQESQISVRTGYFTQYAEQPTIATIEYRQSAGQLPEDLSPYDVFLATTDTCNIGEVGWIRPEGEEWERFIVFDCAGHQETVDNFFRPNNIIGEIDYWTAVRWDTLGRGIRGEMMFP